MRAQLAKDPGLRFGAVPVDMVTTSGSGLDPDITVANARAQAPRVAAARGMRLAEVLALVVEPHHRPPARLPRRAARQRPQAEPGARRGPGDQGTLMARDPQAEPPAASDSPDDSPRTSARGLLAPARCASAADSRCSSATRPASARPTRCSPRPIAGAARGEDVVIGFVETARPQGDERPRRRPRAGAAQGHRVPRQGRSRSSTPPPSSPASRRWRWSTSSRTPTSPGRPTRSAGRAWRRSSRPGSTC